MSTVSELESAIEKLSEKEFRMLAAWVEQRSRTLEPNQFSQAVPRQGVPARDHSSFLNGYALEDEGLYDDNTPG